MSHNSEENLSKCSDKKLHQKSGGDTNPAAELYQTKIVERIKN